jgi:hypothetical protein
MNTILKALELTRHAIILLEEEVVLHNRGAGSVGVLAQLDACKEELCEMLAQLESGCLPPPNQRLRGMGHMIADSWPINSTLGDALLLAEQAYRSAENTSTIARNYGNYSN